MKQIAYWIWTQPAIAVGVPTVVLAAAAGVWQEPWLAFAAAAFAGLGTVFTRNAVTPLERPRDVEGKPLYTYEHIVELVNQTEEP